MTVEDARPGAPSETLHKKGTAGVGGSELRQTLVLQAAGLAARQLSGVGAHRGVAAAQSKRTTAGDIAILRFSRPRAPGVGPVGAVQRAGRPPRGNPAYIKRREH